MLNMFQSKFQSNHSTKYRDIASHEIGVNGWREGQQPDRRTTQICDAHAHCLLLPAEAQKFPWIILKPNWESAILRPVLGHKRPKCWECQLGSSMHYEPHTVNICCIRPCSLYRNNTRIPSTDSEFWTALLQSNVADDVEFHCKLTKDCVISSMVGSLTPRFAPDLVM